MVSLGPTPLIKIAPPGVKSPGKDISVTGLKAALDTPPPTRKPRILVVEDNIINRTVLLRQLKHVGIRAEGELHDSC